MGSYLQIREYVTSVGPAFYIFATRRKSAPGTHLLPIDVLDPEDVYKLI